MKKLLFLITVLVLDATLLHAENVVQAAETEILQLLEKRFPSQYIASSIRIDRLSKGTRVISSSRPHDRSPSAGSVFWILNHQGTIEYFREESFVSAMKQEFPLVTSDKERYEIASLYIRYHSLYSTGKIIDSTNEIPGYQENPLPLDYQSAVRPPWSYPSTNPEMIKTMSYVCYTYNRNGGSVIRYEFVYCGDVLCKVQVTGLMGGIGSYTRLE